MGSMGIGFAENELGEWKKILLDTCEDRVRDRATTSKIGERSVCTRISPKRSADDEPRRCDAGRWA